MSDFAKSVSTIPKSYDRVVNRNKNVRIGVLGVLVLYCVLVVPVLTLDNLRVLENNTLRIVLILAISLLCLLDPVVSIMLAICFVVTLHRLNVLRDQVPKKVSNTVINNVTVDESKVNDTLCSSSKDQNDGIINDSDLDINNNVVNNNVVNNVNGVNVPLNNVNAANNLPPNNVVVDNVVNNVPGNNVAVNNALNNGVNNVAVNNVSLNNANNMVNNSPLNNRVVNNDLLNNSAAVNTVNPNGLDYLNDNMNVLTNKDNSAANIVPSCGRYSRNMSNNVSGFDSSELNSAHKIGGNLLMDDTQGYVLDTSNKLRGPYRNNVMPNNSDGLTGRQVPPSNNPNNANNSNNSRNNNLVDNFQVNGYNSNNLGTKNPFPGNNTNFHVEPQQAELNVSGFNHTEPEQLVIDNNNVVEELQVDGNNAEGFHGGARKEHFIVPNKQEQFNSSNGLNSLNNVESINNLVNLASNNNNNLNNILNNSEQQLVGNNNQVAINNIVNNASNNLENVPQNLLFTSPDQLQSAQDRSVYCDGTKNNSPILSAEGSHSAQGYNLPGDVNGFNQYGAPAINYLCVADEC